MLRSVISSINWRNQLQFLRSNAVELTLLAGGLVYPLAQVGPEFVILQEPGRRSHLGRCDRRAVPNDKLSSGWFGRYSNVRPGKAALMSASLAPPLPSSLIRTCFALMSSLEPFTLHTLELG